MNKPPVPTFNDNWAGNLGLLCPKCGETYTEHTSVEVFERHEDADSGLRVRTLGDNEHCRVDKNMKGNPTSARRGGLRIPLVCEDVNCDHSFKLTMVQHKWHSLLSLD